MQARSNAGRRPWAGLRCCLLALLALLPAVTSHAADPPSVASLVLDLPSGATRRTEQPSVIDRPVLPGSVMKIAGIAAALDAHLIDDRTGIVCTRTVSVAGHRLTCTHPDLHRPLTPAEALTYSCNVYMATVAGRLPRAAFDHALTSLGLPPSDPAVSVAASALGLEGNRMTPRALIAAVARVAGQPVVVPWAPATRDVVLAGLRGAAREGTAAALGAAGIDALAKTGTVGSGGISQGLVVGVTPAAHPTTGFALLVAGGAGTDAAALMAQRLSPSSPHAASIRIGVIGPAGEASVREMNLDDYVAGVTAGEAAAGASPAALQALAVAVRTYALANRGRHESEGFDLCDLTHCQVLRGATPTTSAAARATSRLYLTDQGAPAQVFYSASCGGYTEKPSAVWRGASDPPFLPSRRDDACASRPAWTSEVSASDLLRALRAGGFRGEQLRTLAVTARTGSGRAAWLHADGVSPSDVSGENLRTLVGRTLGWQHLRSTLFDVTRTGAGFRFTGHGAGHGVGLCVEGAAIRAREGSSRDEILRVYYPGLVQRYLDVPGAGPAAQLRLVLPREQEPQRVELQRLVDRLLRETRVALRAADEPPGIVLRFHPTVESYQRATGRPWFTAGATRGTEIDLLPLTVLRQRGLLEPTLRHELAHVLPPAPRAGEPLWLQEGRAVWAERHGSTSVVSEPALSSGPTTCPADAEFSRATSGDALGRVYARALGCYERELQQRGR